MTSGEEEKKLGGKGKPRQNPLKKDLKEGIILWNWSQVKETSKGGLEVLNESWGKGRLTMKRGKRLKGEGSRKKV